MTWRPSIRLFVPLVLVTPILAVTAALVTLSTVTGNRVAENLAQQWVTGATAHVEREVRDFLAAAVRTSDRYARRIVRGSLPAGDLASWSDRLVDELATTPDLAAITYGDPRGNAVWLLRGPNGLELATVDGATGEAAEFLADAANPESLTPLRTSRYDPRKRPWYQSGLGHGEPAWTPIYSWYSEASDAATQARVGAAETGAGYTRALHTADGDLLGVLVVDVTMRGLSDFLRRSPVARQGFLFVLDDAGFLVAASDGPVVSAVGDRLKPLQSSSLAARSLGELIGHAQATSHVARVVFADGTPARVTVTPLQPYPGLHWQIAAVVPEAVFLEEVQAAQQRAAMIGVVAAIGAVVLGLILARHIVDPILRLRAHTREIGAGHLDTRLELRSAREIEELAGDLNRMTAGLKDALEVKQALAVADEVQQSLLPQAPPNVPGLDVAGMARYCDATGGDYFDFIDLAELPHKRVLIAVGDVMGHGVAAALLMATARAALRSAAAAGGSLGELTTRVNDILARDARHGRFMTLALAIIEPETRTLRWASAGHDAPIVIDPRVATALGRDADDNATGNGAAALEGGDLPLGIQDGITYEEYTVPLPHGAVVLIGTDGIWEARNAEGTMFGKRRLHDLLVSVADRDAPAISDAVREGLATFVGPERIRDDVTFVVMKLR